MEKPAISKEYLRQIKQFRGDVKLAWDHYSNRYVFVRIVGENLPPAPLFTCEDDDGNYVHPNDSHLFRLKICYDWQLIDQYKGNHIGMWDKIHADKKAKKDHEHNHIQSEKKYWHKQNLSRWKKALENARSGIITLDQLNQVKGKKIIVPVGG